MAERADVAVPRAQEVGRGRGARTAADPSDPVRQYLDEIGRVPLLTKDDEAVLGRAIEQGRDARAELAARGLPPARRAELRELVEAGDAAFDRFVQANLRLVVSVARRYQRQGVPLLDLVQEGNLGLVHAVEKFEWRRGFKFSTYATWWIRQAIQRSLPGATRPIRLPAHAWEELSSLQRTSTRLETELRRRPTRAELAAETGLDASRVELLLSLAAEPRSLDEPIGDDGDAGLGDVVVDPDATDPADHAARSTMPEVLAQMLSVLDERERFIVTRRYGMHGDEPQSFGDVGRAINLTRERVRQLEARALSKLRHPSNGIDGRSLLAG